jgi:AsmA protein
MAAIAILVLTQINPNTYKDRVTQTISQQMGLEVSIDDISWSFFPWLGMQAQGISLQNPNLAANDPARQLLQMQKADIKVKLMPLFSGNVQIGTLRLDQPKVTYHTKRDGKSNWQSTHNAAVPSTTADSNNSAPPFNMIDIDALVIDQANVSFQDVDQHWQLYPVNVTLSGIRLQNQILLQPVQIAIDVHAEDKNLPQTKLDLELKTDLSLQLPQQDFNQLIAQLSPLTLQVKFQDTAYPHGIKADFKADLQVDLSKDQLILNKLYLSVDDAKFSGEATVTQLMQQPQITASLSLAPMHLANWLQKNLKLSLDFPPDRLQQVGFEGKIKTDGKTLRMQPLLIQMDQSKIQGELLISDLQKQALQANLQIDQLNLDQYFPPPPVAGASSTTTTSKTAVNAAVSSADTSELFPVATLRQLNLQTQLSVKQLRVRHIDIHDAQLKINANNGLLKLSQLQANVLEGVINASGELDVRGATPKLTIKPSIKQVQIQPLLVALQQKPMLSGELNINAEASTQGQTVSQLTQGLMSQLNVSVDRGALKDINLLQKIQEAITTLTPLITALMPNKVLPKLPAALSSDTEFKQLLASANIENGIVKMSQFNAGLEQAQLQGGANWSLVNNQGDLSLQIALSDNLVSPALAAIRWPVNCQVNLVSMPKCLVDLNPIRQQLEKSVASAAKDAAKQKLNESINKQLGLESGADTEAVAKEAAAAALKEKESSAKQKAEEKLNKALDKLFK